MIICANPRPNRRRSSILNDRIRTACIFVGGMVIGQVITMWLVGIL